MDRETTEGHEQVLGPSRIGFSLRNVTYAWEGGSKPVLADVSIDLPAGTITVVVGPSGVGKTTLLLLLSRLLVPQSGSVVASLPDGKHDLGEVREQILSVTAYVGPDPFVISGSLRDFLMFGQRREVCDGEILGMLELAHCDFVRELPGGLDYRIAEQGGGLSAGQKQRLSIARALLRKPRLLLLDEATANLDNESERAIIDTVSSLRHSVTVVAVTHREAMKGIADSVLTFHGSGSVTLVS